MTASQNIRVKMKKNNQILVLIKYFYHAIVKLFTENIKTER